MYEIISLLVGIIGSTTSGAIDTARERIKQEGITSRAYMEGAKAQMIAQWKIVEQGYAAGDILSAELAKKYLAEKAKQRKVKDEQDRNRQVWIVGIIAAAALLVIVIVLRKK